MVERDRLLSGSHLRVSGSKPGISAQNIKSQCKADRYTDDHKESSQNAGKRHVPRPNLRVARVFVVLYEFPHKKFNHFPYASASSLNFSIDRSTLPVGWQNAIRKWPGQPKPSPGTSTSSNFFAFSQNATASGSSALGNA